VFGFIQHPFYFNYLFDSNSCTSKEKKVFGSKDGKDEISLNKKKKGECKKRQKLINEI